MRKALGWLVLSALLPAPGAAGAVVLAAVRAASVCFRRPPADGRK